MYAPDRITLSFWLKDSIALAPDSEMNTTSVLIENYAPVLKNEKPTFLESGKFVENSIGGNLSHPQTFTVALPNPIHNSKKLDIF